MRKATLQRSIIGIVLIIIIAILVGVYHHQQTYFNRNVSINNTAVGGLTAQQAFDKVKNTKRQPIVYVNGQQVYTGKTVASGFQSSDEQRFQKALKQQATFFPSRKHENLVVAPAHLTKPELTKMNAAVTTRVQQLNVHRKAPRDAYARYQNGKIAVIPAVKGTKYSNKGLAQTLSNDYANGTIRLQLHTLKPLTANSQTVKNEKNKLSQLKHRTVTYQVENKNYRFATDDVISTATYQHGHYQFNTDNLNRHIQAINNKQATLGKSYRFKTPSGQVITTNNTGTFGWRINSRRAGQTLAQALANNTKQVNARKDLEGKGWSHLGTGYGITSNHGLGDTYAAVSLADQHAWFYKNGKCVLSTDIVSGTDDKSNRTPKGVWYIMYQQSPSVLRGSNDDGSSYSSPVKYWSPFTLSGCGFHDASWRTNWSKTAYKAINGNASSGGSHGCINMHPYNAGKAFHALSAGEPVIIY